MLCLTQHFSSPWGLQVHPNGLETFQLFQGFDFLLKNRPLASVKMLSMANPSGWSSSSTGEWNLTPIPCGTDALRNYGAADVFKGVLTPEIHVPVGVGVAKRHCNSVENRHNLRWVDVLGFPIQDSQGEMVFNPVEIGAFV